MRANSKHGAITHPEFRDPPIVEQAIGVSFEPKEALRPFEIGQFRSSVTTDFPEYTIAHELPLTTEGHVRATEFRLELIPNFVPGIRYLLKGADTQLQIQSNRFIFNWSRVGDSAYLRYASTCEYFFRYLKMFNEFCVESGFGSLSLQSAEITNLNILVDASFGGINAMETALAVAPARPADVGTKLESFAQLARYAIYDRHGNVDGRLHADLQPVIQVESGEASQRLELTARSYPTIADADAAKDFLDRSHEAINATFMAMTTSTMHAKWGLHDVQR